ncbi:S8 family serine peptidase [Desulfatibacillum aliphaticivorans]|uniref:S8 family serine peptidase n=1 Tax=Desulfatibacillum aliphaticivorans TaxID=218208 RepID=UPI000400653F|nr:S8 family serine peptidase [Desulfatibacillum aliphaticivorans]
MEKIYRTVGIFFILILGVLTIVATSGGIDSDKSTSVENDSSNAAVFSPSATFQEIQGIETFSVDGYDVKAAADQMLVYVSSDVTQVQLDALVAKIKDLGGTVIGSDRDLLVIQVETDNELGLIDALQNMDGVNGAGLNMVCALSAAVEIPDLYGDGDWWIEKINAQEAWNITTGSAAVTIGIVDTGLKAGQEILDENRLERYDYLGHKIKDDDTWNFYKGHHGLWVTGFAAGYMDDAENYDDQNGHNVRGVNQAAKVVLVDVGKKKIEYEPDIGDTCFPLTDLCWLHSTAITNVLYGIETAIFKGSNIVNVSIGIDTKDCPNNDCKETQREEWRAGINQAVQVARKNRALLMFSAGNDSYKHDDNLFDLPDAQKEATMEEMWKNYTIIVGATCGTPGYDSIFEWNGSRMGDVVDILAPGCIVGFAQGGVDVITPGRTGDGTSYAAPLVAGACSLVKGLNTTLLPPEIKHIVTSTAPEIVTTSYSPKKHLDMGAAVKSAMLTQNVVLKEESEQAFTYMNQEKNLTIQVQVPDSGISGADILFITDISGSYYDDIDTFQKDAAAIIQDLTDRDLDIQFGVAAFSDFPIDPYGYSEYDDEAFVLLQSITDQETDVINAVNLLDQPLRHGGDLPESQLEALYQAAGGSGRDVDGNGSFEDLGDIPPTLVGWRDGVQKIIVLSTDAPFHDSSAEPAYPGPTFSETLTKLQESKIIVIGLESGDTEGDLQDVVDATDGFLFDLSSDSAEMADRIAEAMDEIQSSVDVSWQEITGGEFIKSLTPAKYTDVAPGSTVDFELTLSNPKNIGKFGQSYDVIIWFKAEDSLIQREWLPVYIQGGE